MPKLYNQNLLESYFNKEICKPLENTEGNKSKYFLNRFVLQQNLKTIQLQYTKRHFRGWKLFLKFKYCTF